MIEHDTPSAMVRVVLKSGSFTELLFQKKVDARKIAADIAPAGEDGPWQAADDFGLTMTARAEDVAAVVYIDVETELKGQSALIFARQMMQDRLSERVSGARSQVRETGSAIKMPSKSLILPH